MHPLPLALSLLALAACRALAADAPFTLASADLPPGKPIPERHSANTFGCHGPNESPALSWSHAPTGTKSFAVTMFDPTQPPASGWWHWLVVDLPPTTTQLPRKAGDPGEPRPAARGQAGAPRRRGTAGALLRAVSGRRRAPASLYHHGVRAQRRAPERGADLDARQRRLRNHHQGTRAGLDRAVLLASEAGALDALTAGAHFRAPAAPCCA